MRYKVGKQVGSKAFSSPLDERQLLDALPITLIRTLHRILGMSGSKGCGMQEAHSFIIPMITFFHSGIISIKLLSQTPKG